MSWGYIIYITLTNLVGYSVSFLRQPMKKKGKAIGSNEHLKCGSVLRVGAIEILIEN